MSNAKGFSDAIAHEKDATQADLAIKVAWFLEETEGNSDVTLKNVVDFLNEHGICPNVNPSRLKGQLAKHSDISAPAGKPLRVKLGKKKDFRIQYAQYLDPPVPEITDSILQLGDFKNARKYIQEIARQINGTHQTQCYDACAVMMRRLIEILIIDAYEAKGARAKILDGNGNYLIGQDLIGAITSGATFKLSRTASKDLKQIKEVGDKAAHDLKYITKSIDIDDIKYKFRQLVTELSQLN